MRRAITAVALVLGSLTPLTADAAGLFVADRGVRPLGRGGAWIAGANDAAAIWYNPAGLADAGTTLYVDFAWLNFTSEYTRKTLVRDESGGSHIVQSPQVNGTTPFLPIPTIAGSYNFGEQKEFTAAFATYAPYTAIASYPLTINGGDPSPSRYSLVSLDGSALLVLGGSFAYKPIEEFRVGASLQAMVGKFKSTTVFTANPADRLIGAPEDPQYDTFSQLDVGPIIAPSANFGMIGSPHKNFRIGVSGQLPFWINAPATVKVRLPNAAVFDKAYQDGEEAHVRFRLPPIARIGVEYRLPLADNDLLRFEIAYVREFWSLHDSIDIRSDNIKLYNITGFPSPFGVAPITLPRNFQDSNSFRFGTEYDTNSIFAKNRTTLRAGISYETSGIPQDWVSPLTYDANKIVGSLGGSIHVGEHWRMDAVFALVLYDGTEVDPGTAMVPRINPVKGNPVATEAVNGGTYSARATLLGVGVQYKF